VEVPLIVWEPGGQPGRSPRPVQSPDLFPTILGYLGLPVPEGTQGQPLQQADHPTVSEEYYALMGLLRGSNGRRFDRVLRTIGDGEHRYFHSSNGEERLFQRRDDPRETNNLIAERPEVAAAARARLEAWLRSTPEAQPRKEVPKAADPEALESLRALGYVR
jgi:arylsulfatase A-like enzyme